MSGPLVPWKNLKEDEDFYTYTKDSLGYRFREFVTGLDVTNRVWWELSFVNLKKEAKVNPNFWILIRNIVYGYSDKEEKNSFNALVKEIYKKDHTKLSPTDIEFVFRFCTPNWHKLICS